MQTNIKKTVNLDDLAAGHNKRFPRKKFGTLIRCSRLSVRAVAAEVCEELFTPIPLHAELALNGVEVFMNTSGSHHQLRKLDLRLRNFIGATHSRGGVYMYSNHQGCDGGRLYYDGCSCVVVNGDVVAQGSQFSLKDVEVVVAQIDLDAGSGFLQWDVIFQENWQLTVGCNLPGKWVLHWGVNYVNDIGRKGDKLYWFLGALGQLSSMLLKSEGAHPKGEDSSESRYPNQKDKSLEGFYEEHSIVREVLISNSVTVSVRKCPEMAKNLLYMERDLLYMLSCSIQKWI
ncbi:Glutamine-dependent NAD(+) synthetase [Camellia lanceoleosa]|uniref:Glutamine-dependent NAD(+) synthetase n=1 Tax=Camellia lanceoleosa TaxID=1840588 RepID=A0ACC0HCI5_9ERIC|nr:Glutamine-dependent NAD(+) synthetase [Camellia lanceoleosa]